MLFIKCPHCGPRGEQEFIYGGGAESWDPLGTGTAAANDCDWNAYLYCAGNKKGWCREYWYHAFGCGSWFELSRNTHTHEIGQSGSGLGDE